MSTTRVFCPLNCIAEGPTFPFCNGLDILWRRQHQTFQGGPHFAWMTGTYRNAMCKNECVAFTAQFPIYCQRGLRHQPQTLPNNKLQQHSHFSGTSLQNRFQQFVTTLSSQHASAQVCTYSQTTSPSERPAMTDAVFPCFSRILLPATKAKNMTFHLSQTLYIQQRTDKKFNVNSPTREVTTQTANQKKRTKKGTWPEQMFKLSAITQTHAHTQT